MCISIPRGLGLRLFRVSLCYQASKAVQGTVPKPCGDRSGSFLPKRQRLNSANTHTDEARTSLDMFLPPLRLSPGAWSASTNETRRKCFGWFVSAPGYYIRFPTRACFEGPQTPWQHSAAVEISRSGTEIMNTCQKLEREIMRWANTLRKEHSHHSGT
ncbi:hypothetical protein OG21DRAFT_1308141 [Imleria badia]|nr:hypothetical protein OG21DRAFT_1308141 [Imleria badia]